MLQLDAIISAHQLCSIFLVLIKKQAAFCYTTVSYHMKFLIICQRTPIWGVPIQYPVRKFRCIRYHVRNLGLIPYPVVNFSITVKPFQTDTLRDRTNCPSQRVVRLIEVLKSIDIQQKVLKVQLIVVGQALIIIEIVYQSKVKILHYVAYYETIILCQSRRFTHNSRQNLTNVSKSHL